MPDPVAPIDDDLRPSEPERPLPSDCCESGCPICVYDLYAEEMAVYRERLAAWESRHPAGKPE